MKRRSKYNSKRTSCGSHTHSSAREAKRCGDLQIMLQAGEIQELVQQPEFNIAIKGKHIFSYIADFRYLENSAEIIEDCKGMRTPVYRLKKKLVEAMYGIEIRET